MLKSTEDITPPRADPAPAIAPPAKGVYLQLGAFANADNAETLRQRLSRDLDWLAEPLRVYPQAGIHRLQAGPYKSRGEAEAVAERIRAAVGFKPAIALR